MRLLKKDTPFSWDNFVQRAFDNLKHALTHALVLQPPNYTKDYSLYVVASLSTIGMVLVQTYEHDQEHVIYCHVPMPPTGEEDAIKVLSTQAKSP